MEQKEQKLQSLSICNKLFTFITRNLTHHAFKTVTLGQMVHPMPQPPSDHAHVKEPQQLPTTPVSDSSVSSRAYETIESGMSASMAPKKTVSINDRVEEISDKNKTEKKKKKNNKIQKPNSNSINLELDEEEEPKPLKSILKVGSKLYESSKSFPTN